MKHFVILLCLLTCTVYAEDKLSTIHIFSYGEQSSLLDFIPSVTSLNGKELDNKRDVSLGDTLKSEAGVNTTYFGPSAGRPVIRGLDGDRIRLLQNGLSFMDASAQSVDHAVPIDTLVVDQIEIVRGPVGLLYGSSAIGGVVNIVTNRVHSQFEEGLLQEIQVTGESVNQSLGAGARLDYGKNRWMFHLDGSYRNVNELAVPGKVRSSRLRSQAPLAVGEKEEDDKLPNSQSVQKTGSLGISRIFDRGYLGVSVYRFDNFYGSISEEEVTIEMISNRYELHGEYRPENISWLNAVRIKSAQSDYQHQEFEGAEVGTTFKNDGNESRLEFVTKFADWNGVTGLQTQLYRFVADGEEAFLPTSDTQNIALFTLQELRKEKNTLSMGARTETAQVESKASANFGPSEDRGFTNLSGSVGFAHRFVPTQSLALNYSYTERAPTAQELFANGAHLATGIYEQGDATLGKEKAHALELVYKYEDKGSRSSLAVYTQQFQDYIALMPTTTTDPDSGFTVNDFAAVDAVFYGVDLDSRWQLNSWEKRDYWLVFKGDMVRAKNKDTGDNLPRISPARVSVGLEQVKDRWTTDVEIQHTLEQDKVAEDELKTDGFTLMNIGGRYEFKTDSATFNIFARVKNIFDQEARAHTSTMKDVAPLPGRNFMAGIQYLF